MPAVHLYMVEYHQHGQEHLQVIKILFLPIFYIVSSVFSLQR